MPLYHAIILVDDDPINNLINKRLISRLCITESVEEFLDAEKALNRIEQMDKEKRILILLDINMPVMNGWDFLDYYKKHLKNRTDKIIMLSSSIDFKDRKRALTYPQVRAFLEKPLTAEKIKGIV